MEKHNRRRTYYYDLGNLLYPVNVNNDYEWMTRDYWQSAKVSRPSVEWFALIRTYGICDFYDLDSNTYKKILENDLAYFRRYKSKECHWNTVCKLRRLRKPWEAIKTKV